MLLSHTIKFDLGSVVESAEFLADPALKIDKTIQSLDATMVQHEEFQIQFSGETP